jgi:hypothetical protein
MAAMAEEKKREKVKTSARMRKRSRIRKYYFSRYDEKV